MKEHLEKLIEYELQKNQKKPNYKLRWKLTVEDVNVEQTLIISKLYKQISGGIT